MHSCKSVDFNGSDSLEVDREGSKARVQSLILFLISSVESVLIPTQVAKKMDVKEKCSHGMRN